MRARRLQLPVYAPAFFAGEEDFRAAIFDSSCVLWFKGKRKGESYKDRREKSNENMVSKSREARHPLAILSTQE